MNNLTDRFLDRIFRLTQISIPDSVYEKAKERVIDYLGVTLAGSRVLKERGNRLLDFFANKNCEAKVIGFNRKVSVQNAAFVNGICSHILELDDGEREGMIHLGAPILSALLPLAEREKVAPRRLLLAVIVAYEASAILASAIQPSHKELGYHATGTCGCIGAAVGAAVVLDFSKEELKNAISAAVAGTSGILEVMEDDSELKPFNVAKASLGSLVAVGMARAGFRGPDDIFGGKRGFLATMARNPKLDQVATDSFESFRIEKIYTKLYAACRHSHPAIDAALKIRSVHRIRSNGIKEVKVYTYKWAVNGHEHTVVKGLSSAKMSIPFSVALAFEYGNAGISEFCSESIQDPGIVSLASKVSVIADDNLTSLVPEKRAAIVQVAMYDGRVYTERVDYPKGEPENPLSKQEMEEKFVALAIYGGKSKTEAELIQQYVWKIEDSLCKLFALL